MQGRMIHVRKQGEYVREPQIYDARGKVSVAENIIRDVLIGEEFARARPNELKHHSLGPS